MWSEVGGGGGAVNFITGMGGFLQAREREQLRDYKTTYLIFVRTNIRDYKTKHTGGALRLSWSESAARLYRGFELSSLILVITINLPDLAQFASILLQTDSHWVGVPCGQNGLGCHLRGPAA